MDSMNVEDYSCLFPLDVTVFSATNMSLNVDIIYGLWCLYIWMIGAMSSPEEYIEFRKSLEKFSPFLVAIKGSNAKSFIKDLIKNTRNPSTKALLTTFKDHTTNFYSKTLEEYLNAVYTPENCKAILPQLREFPYFNDPSSGSAFFVKLYDHVISQDLTELTNAFKNMITPVEEEVADTNQIYPSLPIELVSIPESSELEDTLESNVGKTTKVLVVEDPIEVESDESDERPLSPHAQHSSDFIQNLMGHHAYSKLIKTIHPEVLERMVYVYLPPVKEDEEISIEDMNKLILGFMNLLGLKLTKMIVSLAIFDIETVNETYSEQIVNVAEQLKIMKAGHEKEVHSLRETAKMILDHNSKALLKPIETMTKTMEIMSQNLINIENHQKHIDSIITCDPFKLTMNHFYHKNAEEELTGQKKPRISDPVGQVTISGSKTSYNPNNPQVQLDYSDDDFEQYRPPASEPGPSDQAAPQPKNKPIKMLPKGLKSMPKEISINEDLRDLINQPDSIENPVERTKVYTENVIPFLQEGLSMVPDSKVLKVAMDNATIGLNNTLDQQAKLLKKKGPTPLPISKKPTIIPCKTSSLKPTPQAVAPSKPQVKLPSAIKSQSGVYMPAPIDEDDSDSDPGYALFR